MTRDPTLQRHRPAVAAGLCLLTLAVAQPTLAQQAQRNVEKHAQTSDRVVRVEAGKFTQTTKITATARILGIDRTYRTIGLKPPNADSFDVVAGPEVKNLDQLNAGDQVQAVYLETISLQLKKAGTPTAAPTDEHVVSNVPPGGSSTGGTATRKASAVADVVAIEPAVRRVTLRGPSGEKLRLLVKDQAQFDNIQVGDHVEITYDQALALSITRQ